MKNKKINIKKIYRLPGELLYTGDKKIKEQQLLQISYTEDKFKKRTSLDLSDKSNNLVVVEGINNLELMKELGEKLKLHKLILEDILSTSQNIKINIYEDITFITLRHFNFNTKKQDLDDDQISIVLKGSFLYIFLEEPNELITLIQERIKEKKGVIREKNQEYLLFAILDTLIDNYILLLSNIEDSILKYEENINTSPEEVDIKDIFKLKKQVYTIKRNSFYLREMLKKIVVNNINFSKENKIYFEDLYDKSLKIYDYTEDCKDDISELLNYHMTQLSNNMNKIMKVLTFISTIFIPISFLAGLYGMNFSYMPELNFKYSYPLLLLVMLAIVLIMIRFFKNRKWF